MERATRLDVRAAAAKLCPWTKSVSGRPILAGRRARVRPRATPTTTCTRSSPRRRSGSATHPREEAHRLAEELREGEAETTPLIALSGLVLGSAILLAIVIALVFLRRLPRVVAGRDAPRVEVCTLGPLPFLLPFRPPRRWPAQEPEKRAKGMEPSSPAWKVARFWSPCGLSRSVRQSARQ